MICKKCGYDVDKYEVIYAWESKKVRKDGQIEGFSEPHCPCGARL